MLIMDSKYNKAAFFGSLVIFTIPSTLKQINAVL